MIAAARLDRDITLLAPPETPMLNGAGEATSKPRPVWSEPAEIKQTAATEALSNGHVVTRVTYQITIRWRDDVDESWSVQLDDGRKLSISSVIERGRREELVITCTEVRR